MSRLRLLATFLGPVFVLATVAVALRMGAEPPGLAAQLVAMPPPETADRLVWQVRVLYEARRIRSVAAGVVVEAVAKRGDETSSARGTTGPDGVVELGFSFRRVASGDAIAVSLVGGGGVLAEGTVRVPEAATASAPTPLRATTVDGAVALALFGPPGGVAPSLESSVWLEAHGPTEPVSLALEPETGLELPQAQLTACRAGLTRVPVRAFGHVLGLRVTATAPGGARGSWFGPVPASLGGDEISIEPSAPVAGSAVSLRVRSPTQKTVLYLELWDERGRVFATQGEPRLDGGFGKFVANAGPLPAGRYFAVASSRPDGFAPRTTTSLAFAVTATPPSRTRLPDDTCDAEGPLRIVPPPAFARAVTLDGFERRYALAAEKRSRGLRLAMAALAVGMVMATLVMFSALRKSAPKGDASLEELASLKEAATPRWIAVAILFGLSLLAYLLFSGLVLYSGH